jgi:hypothetical protein
MEINKNSYDLKKKERGITRIICRLLLIIDEECSLDYLISFQKILNSSRRNDKFVCITIG